MNKRKGYSYSHTKPSLGKHTASTRKLGWVWRKPPSGGMPQWVIRENIRYNPRHLPTITDRR